MMTRDSDGSASVQPYASLEEMRAIYSDLLQRYGESSNGELPAGLLEDADGFISRGRETGTLLDNTDERWDAQSMINFWATIVYRYRRDSGEDPPVTTLSLFGRPDSPSDKAEDVPFLAPPIPENLYVGRARFLSDLKEQLLAGRNIALYGPPGSGKTLIATMLAHDDKVRERFSDGVLWANLGDRSGLPAILDIWSKALGIASIDSNRFDIEYRQKIMRQTIGRKRMLLVIDDAWQADKALMLKLGGPNCAHILTSYLMPIALGFDAESIVDTPDLDPSDGLALLKQDAPQAFVDEAKDAQELVKLLNGSPLALAILAKWYGSQSADDRPEIKEMVRQLAVAKESFETELGAAMNAVQFDQMQTPPSLLATIDWSFKHLKEKERDLLRAFSSFPPKPNSFSESAAKFVAGDHANSLQAITNYGLLEKSSCGYTLHRAIYDYLKRWPKQRVDNASDRRMVQFFVALAKGKPADSPVLEQEEKNILAALDIAFDRKMWKLLIEGVNALLGYFDRTGSYTLAKHYLDRARAAAEKSKDRENLLETFLNLGEMEERLSQYAEAKNHLLAALKFAKDENKYELISRALQGLGVVTMAQADYERAEQYLDEALDLARRISNTERVSAIYTRLAWIERGRGNYTKSREHTENGLKLALENNDKGQMAELHLNLGVLAFHNGEYAEAEKKQEYYTEAEKYDEEGLRYAEEARDRRLRCGLLQALGGVEIKLGKYEDAHGHLLESLRLSREIGHRWYTSVILKELGELKLAQHFPSAASEYFIKSLELARRVNSPELIGLALFGLARVAAERNNLAEARLQGQTSLNIFQSMNYHKKEDVKEWLKQIIALEKLPVET